MIRWNCSFIGALTKNVGGYLRYRRIYRILEKAYFNVCPSFPSPVSQVLQSLRLKKDLIGNMLFNATELLKENSSFDKEVAVLISIKLARSALHVQG